MASAPPLTSNTRASVAEPPIAADVQSKPSAVELMKEPDSVGARSGFERPGETTDASEAA